MHTVYIVYFNICMAYPPIFVAGWRHALRSGIYITIIMMAYPLVIFAIL